MSITTRIPPLSRPFRIHGNSKLRNIRTALHDNLPRTQPEGCPIRIRTSKLSYEVQQYARRSQHVKNLQMAALFSRSAAMINAESPFLASSYQNKFNALKILRTLRLSEERSISRRKLLTYRPLPRPANCLSSVPHSTLLRSYASKCRG